jgi:hypothetical protein
MKFAQFGIVALTGIMIVILCTGCITPKVSAPAAGSIASESSTVVLVTTSTQTSTISPVPTTPACAYPPLNPWTWVPESYSPAAITKLPPAPGTLVSEADLFGTPSLQWEEYESTQQIRGIPDSYVTAWTEMSIENTQGKSIIHENYTYGLHPEGEPLALLDTNIDDMYYDEYGNMLSMHRQVIGKGEVLENKDYPPANENRGTPDCSGEIFTPRYTFVGIDPVTVPAGTYPGAMKYTVDSDDDQLSNQTSATYWFAPGVPVPVKWILEDPEKGQSITYELAGWK